MYYLTKSKDIISDKQLKESKGIFKFGSSICYYVNIDDDEFETLDHIIKESDNVYDLIERETDLVKIELLGNYFNIVEAKTLNGNWKENDRISTIYKPNANGDYIKVWEKESD